MGGLRTHYHDLIGWRAAANPGSEDPQASGRRRGSSRALGRFGSESPRLLQIGLPRKEQPALFSTPYFLLVGVYINRVQKLAYLVFRQ
jgi:hypothetical protein